MTCYNLSRNVVSKWTTYLNPEEHAWISIQEPKPYKGHTNDHIENEYLDALPNLKLKFWDISYNAIDLATGETVTPMSEEDAQKIVDFCLEHKGKNILTNCMAGKCRSGAICAFLENMLEYKWSPETKKIANPNSHVYNSLCNYFLTFNTKPTKIIDNRRISI